MTDLTPDSYSDMQRVAYLIDVGRHQQAVQAAERALAADPNQTWAWCLMSQAHLGLGEDQAALDAARRAIATSPESLDGHRFASLALTHLGRHKEAIESANVAARLSPWSWRSMARLAWAHAANPSTKDWTEARTAASKAVELGPLEPGAFLAAGAVEAAAKDRNAARAAYERVLALDPQNSTAHNELARLHLRQGPARLADAGGLARAATGFASAIQSNPDSAVSRHNLDVVVGAFLARAAYLLFLASWIVFRGFGVSDTLASRLLPLAILVVPSVFVGRFLHRLTPTLRRYVRSAIVHPRVRLLSSIAEAVAVASIIAGTFAPEASRATLGIVALVSALVGRVALMFHHRRKPARTA